MSKNIIPQHLLDLIPDELPDDWISHCCICRLPLKDADSVDCGIGPVCRKKSGYNHLSRELRSAANQVLRFFSWKCAGRNLRAEDVLVWGDWMQEEGMERLFAAVCAYFAAVHLEPAGDTHILFYTRRHAAHWERAGRILRERLNALDCAFVERPRRSGWLIPRAKRAEAVAGLSDFFGGRFGIDERGRVFQIPLSAEPQPPPRDWLHNYYKA